MHTHPQPGLAASHRRRSASGFTLIELLVAISIMAVMTIMAWRTLDGMQRASTQARTHTDLLLTLDAGLAQWVTDLDGVQELANTTPMDFNGRVLRLTRRNTVDPTEGVLVVAWARDQRDGTDQWLRWQSAPVRSRQAWQAAWRTAALWAENQGVHQQAHEVAIVPLESWQMYYFRGGAWSNPLSSAGAASPADAASNVPPAMPTSKGSTSGPGPGPAPAASASDPQAQRQGIRTPVTDNTMPDGVRLILTLPSTHPLAGTITRDWSRPTTIGAAQ